ncbi:MAG TPA: metalloregulator ArsR/SmtB family transcription factor [Candidatus Polarisedimenticolaceae bacterium]|nr:metalloregulator ArsR/SmtB family transcription factor [Candidatus Polarisedimenticolaceae bacterium]
MSRAPAILQQMTVLGDPFRSRLLAVLERGELTVGEICRVLQAPQSTVSRHLKALADAGWLVSRPDGTNRRYALHTAGLPPGSRALWLVVRKELADTPASRQDERRLEDVLADRRTRSQAFFAAGAAQWDRVRDEMFGHGFFLPALLGLADDRTVVGDLGCGTGPVAEAIAPYVGRVVAVDASPAMLRAARKRLARFPNVEVKAGALEALPLDDASLDAAIVVLVLHHVEDPAAALREVARTLKPSGRLVVVDMLPHDREEYRQHMGHRWLGFQEADILRALEEAGLAEARVRPLPADPKAKGPVLFAARAVRPAVTKERQAASSRR